MKPYVYAIGIPLCVWAGSKLHGPEVGIGILTIAFGYMVFNMYKLADILDEKFTELQKKTDNIKDEVDRLDYEYSLLHDRINDVEDRMRKLLGL